MKVFSRIENFPFDILVMTSPDFEKEVQDLSELIQIPLKTKIFSFNTLQDSYFARIHIYDYEHIHEYDKILYIDTDILVQNDLSSLFLEPLDEKVYGLSEGTIEHEYHGGWFFDFNTIDKNIPGMNSGILIFPNTPTICNIFEACKTHVNEQKRKGAAMPATPDQAFLNYHFIKGGNADTTLLAKYALIYCINPPLPPSQPTTIALCHFVWPMGNVGHKLERMQKHLTHLLNNYSVIYPSSYTPETNKILKAFYKWGTNGYIIFESDTRFDTLWGLNNYKWLSSRMIEANWCGYNHILQFSPTFDSFFSIRKGDCTIGHHPRYKQVDTFLSVCYPKVSSHELSNRNEIDSKRNLIYMCVFLRTEYLTMLKFLLQTIVKYTNLEGIDILIITSHEYRESIQKIANNFNIQLNIMIVEGVMTGRDASISKLNIFDYAQINEYGKILYLDTDILTQKDLSLIFKIPIENRAYFLGECTIGGKYHGSWFFDYTLFDSNIAGLNAGCFLFPNTPEIKSIFQICNEHIDFYKKNALPFPSCYEQPYMTFHFINSGYYNSTIMNDHLHLTYKDLSTKVDKSIVHFAANTDKLGIKVARIEQYKQKFLKLFLTSIDNNRCLIYACVFNNPKYVDLLELLLKSFAKTKCPDNTDFLIMTSSNLQPSIQEIANSLKLPIKFMLKDEVLTSHESSCMRLKIFDYPNIDNYGKILYLDTDILIQHSLQPLLNIPIEDQLYALEEGTIAQDFHGSWYFDFNTISSKTPAINAGVFLFLNTPLMKNMFKLIYADIEGKRARKERFPNAYEQLFINYHFISAGKCNSTLLKDYAQIFFQNPTSIPTVPICHFGGNMGDADDKLPRMKAHMERFITPNKIPGKYLVYACVFYNKDYTELLRLLIASTKFYSSLQEINFLVLTSKEIEPAIQQLANSYNFPILTKTFDYTTIFQAACARLSIFDYEGIHSYEKILYLDTDILVKGDLRTLFDLPLEDKLYGLESGFTDSINFGVQFFNPPRKVSGINSGTLLFPNSSTIQALFQRIQEHIHIYTKSGATPPYALDQPFINYHAIKDNLYDNQVLKPHVSLFEGEGSPENEETAIICHFSFPIGNFGHKCNRMKTYLNKCLNHSTFKNNVDSKNTLIHKRFSWGNGFIEFLDNYILNTSWGRGIYEHIENNIVRINWNNYYHIIYIKEDGYFGLRTTPNDFSSCIGINKCISIKNTIEFDETKVTPLCEIMGKHGSDKGSKDITKSWHNYTTLYYSLLKDKQETVKRVFELGLGTTDTSIPNNMGPNGKPGASLRGWAEFFPSAQVFGADIDKRILFTEDRIKTYYCDQLNPIAIKGMWLNKDLVEGFDLILDDGLHRYDANICFLENSIHKLNPGGIYIIEDIHNHNLTKFNEKLDEFKKLHPDLQYDLVTLPSTVNTCDNRVLVITK